MGNIPLAKSYAEKLGSLYYTKESILEWVLEGDEGLEQAQNNLLFYLDMLTMTIETVRIKMLSTPEKQEKFEQLCIDLWKCVLGDENLGFYHCRVANEYFKLAADFAVQKRRASVFVHWRKWLITLLHSIKEEMAFIRNRGLKENLILIKSLQKTILQTTVI